MKHESYYQEYEQMKSENQELSRKKAFSVSQVILRISKMSKEKQPKQPKKKKEQTEEKQDKTSAICDKTMQLAEQHIIDRKDPRYKLIDDAAFKSKNLYNAALYEMRQTFIHHSIFLSFSEMDKRMQQHEAYKALPAKVSQHVLKQLVDAWEAFREAQAAYEEDPSRFTGRPRLPKYKHKTQGRNILVYTLQALSGVRPCIREEARIRYGKVSSDPRCYLLGSDLDGETAYIAQKMERSSVPM
jgi:hypothetical protein